MTENQQISQEVSKDQSAENKRTVPKISLAMMGVGVVAIGAVLSLGAKFVFH